MNNMDNMISIIDIPTVLTDEIFTFLNIIDYICNVILVCKQWNINNKNDLIVQSNLIRKLIYNSCKHKLIYIDSISQKQSITVYDLLYEYELSASYISLYNHDHPPIIFRYPDINYIAYPVYPLYFYLDINMRKVLSYNYLFNYIYLCKFGKRNEENLEKLNVLLIKLLFCGSALCIGLMLDLLFQKYANSMHIHDKLNHLFYVKFEMQFKMYLKHYTNYMKNKEIWVIIQNCYYFLNIGDKYLSLWRKYTFSPDSKPWVVWADRMERRNQSNQLYRIVKSYNSKT